MKEPPPLTSALTSGNASNRQYDLLRAVSIAFRYSHASFLYADDKFIVSDEDGTPGLATPAPTGLNVHSRVELLGGAAWTVPTLLGSTL